MTISMASLSDAGEILALQKLAFAPEAERYGNFTIAPLAQTLEEMEGDIREQTVLKQVTVGRITGSVRARLDSGACLVGRLIVHPEHQRRGIGARLMGAVEALFHPRCQRFEIFTGHASHGPLRLYARLGYAEFKRQAVSPGLELVFMEKFVLPGSPAEGEL